MTLMYIKYLGLDPKEVQIWCDNDETVKSSDAEEVTRKDVMKSDADLVLAIHSLKKQFQTKPRIRHVYSHQDTTKGKETLCKAREREEKERGKNQ